MNKENIKKYEGLFITLSGVVLFYFILKNIPFITSTIGHFLNIISPIIVGICIAFILNIPMKRIEKLLLKGKKTARKKKVVRVVSVLLTLLLFILVISLILFLIIPELINNIKLILEELPEIYNKLESYIIDLLNRYPELQKELTNSFNSISNYDTSSIIITVLSSSKNILLGIVSGLTNLFLGIIFAVYLLLQKEYIIKIIKKLTYAFCNKKVANKLEEIAKLSNETFSKFISGQCLEAIILGTLFFIILFIFDFPYALLISVLTGVLAFIPTVGATIAAIFGAILMLPIDPVKSIIYIIISIVIQQIENNFIYPKVVGKSVGLSGIWTLSAVLVFGSLFGLIGMIIGLPIASILYVLLKEATNNRLKIKKIKVK